jgi:hypothetical protein
MNKKIFLLAVFTCFSSFMFAADDIKGLGNLITKTYDIDAFDEIELSGPVKFNYVQSNDDASTIKVTIDENLISFLKIETEDRKLTVGVMKGVNLLPTEYTIIASSKWLKSVEVTSTGGFYANSVLTGSVLELKATGGGLVELKKEVKVGKLDLLSSGSGNVVVPFLASDELECKLSGSGSITIKGTTPKATYSVTGSGVLNTYECLVADIICKITGSGVAKLHPTEKMKVNIIGSGNVFYKGEANITQRIIGSGTIEAVK